jgi:hypothetical protein
VTTGRFSPWKEKWAFGEEHERKVNLRVVGGDDIASFRQSYGVVPPHDGGEGRARARLAVAAPDLYEALSALLEAHAHRYDGATLPLLQAGEKALKKARGEP